MDNGKKERGKKVETNVIFKHNMVVDLKRNPLVSWNCKSEFEFNPLANSQFIWVDTDKASILDQLTSVCKRRHGGELYLEIRPHYLDDIFVADLTSAIEYKRKCFEETPSATLLTDKQYDEYIARRGANVVTLEEYFTKQLCFANPQFLFRKPIGYDEITRVWHLTRDNMLEIF